MQTGLSATPFVILLQGPLPTNRSHAWSCERGPKAIDSRPKMTAPYIRIILPIVSIDNLKPPTSQRLCS